MMSVAAQYVYAKLMHFTDWFVCESKLFETGLSEYEYNLLTNE